MGDINWNYAEQPAQGGGDAFSSQFGGIVSGKAAPASAPADAFTAAYGAVVKPQPAQPAKAAAPVPAPSQQGKQGTIGATVGGLLKGVTAPIEGGAQLLGHAVTAGAQAIAPNSAVTHWLEQNQAQSDAEIAARNADYKAQVGNSTGAEIGQVVGSVIGPGGAGGKFISGAKSLPGLALRAGVVGGASSAAQPVVIQQPNQPAQPDAVPADQFAQAKAYQALTGAAGGAVAGPAAKVIGGAVAPIVSKVASKVQGAVTPSATVTNQIQAGMAQVEKELANNGQTLADLPPAMRADLQNQVTTAIKSGNTVDPAQLLRQKDFETLGIQPTLGQITRTPEQFTAERNLRGIQGAGEPLAQRFNEQNAQLINTLQTAGAKGAPEADVAGAQLINRLAQIDQPAKEGVTAAYNAARDSSGRSALMDAQTFATNANDTLDQQMLGSSLPTKARGLMNDIATGKIPFTVNNGVQADRVLSQMQRDATQGGDNAGAMAIGKVRDALNSAPIASTEGTATKEAFDAARAAAKNRFDTIAKTPALQGALDDVAPDKFVQKYVISAPTRDTKALSDYISKDPDAQQIVRGQIVNYLQQKAVGTNAAGDTQFAQAAYNKALNQLGTNKLSAFFTPDEVNRLQALGRVAAYINTQPSGSAVNNSNTGAAVMNLFSTLGNSAKSGFSSLPIVQSGVNAFKTFKTEQAVGNALRGKAQAVPVAAPTINRLLGPAAVGTGALIGSQ